MPVGDRPRTIDRLSASRCGLAITNDYANADRLWLTPCSQRRPRRAASADRLSTRPAARRNQRPKFNTVSSHVCSLSFRPAGPEILRPFPETPIPAWRSFRASFNCLPVRCPRRDPIRFRLASTSPPRAVRSCGRPRRLRLQHLNEDHPTRATTNVAPSPHSQNTPKLAGHRYIRTSRPILHHRSLRCEVATHTQISCRPPSSAFASASEPCAHRSSEFAQGANDVQGVISTRVASEYWRGVQTGS